jgi:dTDP-3-amino-3,4,6-trideoxy-alpha-D-glucose transaminase
MSQVPFGDLKRQYETLKADLDTAALRVMAGGWYILGPETRAFEEEFAAFCGVGHAVGVASGTDALQLALVALGVGAGDEVITVANAGVPGTVAILQAGARPVFVEVDEHSFNLDPATLEAAITAHTKAIMPVHLYGRMAEMAPILAIAERYNLPVVEDCAQAHGATYHGQVAGSIGACGCFSFYPTKNLGALGDGGMVVTDDATLAERLRRLRQYGWERKYYSSEPDGANSRLDELQAALLRVKLQHLPEWNARRRQIAEIYDDLLVGADLTLPTAAADGEHVYHLYVVRSHERDHLQAALRERGIGTDIHYPLPAHRQPIYAAFEPAGGLPTTERLAEEVLSLPIYPELTDAEVRTVATAIRETLS